MSTELAEATPHALTLTDDKLVAVLGQTVYHGAKPDSVRLVIEWCRAARVDPMMKPVHIVPMYVDNQATGKKGMQDTIMPSIDYYRLRAARSGFHIGTSDPEWGEEIDLELGGEQWHVPSWCKVTVTKLCGGHEAQFSGVERWAENYASRRRDDERPNAMWSKRRWGQLAKCAEAQALRKAFPELCAGPTAEEMVGKELGVDMGSVIDHDDIALDDVPAAPARKKKTRAKKEPETIEAEPPEETDEPGEDAPEPEEAEPVLEDRSITAGQVRVLRAKLGQRGMDESELIHALDVSKLERLPARRINEAMQWLKNEAA